MRLLLSYTGPIFKDSKGDYYSRSLTDKELSRYFSIASEVNLCTRVKEISDEEEIIKLTKINSENLFVTECPDVFSFKGLILNSKKVKSQIENAVENADIVIARVPCVIGNIVVKTAKKRQKSYLVEVVGCPRDVYWNHSLKGKIAALPSYSAMKNVVKSAPFTLYVTKEFLQQRYPCENNVIGCSDVSLPKLDEGILEKRLSRVNNIKAKSFIIGTTAVVNMKYKGQEYVIEAISRLNKEGYNIEYYLAGGGDNTYLKSIAEKYGVLEKVKFLGLLPHQKVFDYLDNIDIYIQPSKSEGLPRALVEAMSRGCPSLGAKAGGIPELINKKFIFKSGSVDEICTLLKKMDKNTMFEEANRSFEKAKEFDAELLEEQRISFYKQFSKSATLIK